MNRISARTEAAASRSAFTLVELLVVIAIIVILAGLLLSTSGFVQEKAGIERAKNEIAAISTALEAYKLDNGTYPQQPAAKADSDSDDSTKILISELMPTNAGTKVYFSVPKKMLSDTNSPATSYLNDPFGNSYHYQFPGDTNRSGEAFFDLWSEGKAGSRNSGDTNKWIKNW